MSPKVTILVLTWNGLDYTRACLDSICATQQLGTDVEVLVVDNGSTDGTPGYLHSLDWMRVIANR